ncbi:SH3 domain-containing protein [Streptomyces sp. NBC_01571]|uniref:SH3 domain-containing protein n=1 Tax=Streptomyces sp. NBC_01571 TaxID=2975883 RepID=UPI0022556084|nr:SH3 domain-containing protein [Streptomyces sp. NBC_01571]MCX4577242.1 SH3 domain-containing protein [Streptomyces sp. NBC_01571]
MMSRLLRNGIVAAIAAVAVFPVTAVASAGPAAHIPGQGSVPAPAATSSWYQVPSQGSVRRHVPARARHHVTTHRYRVITRHHARHHVVRHVWGRVTTHHMRLLVRSGPGTAYRIVGSRPHGRVVVVSCKKRGSAVRGNHHWYRLAHHRGYVSAHYVRTGGAVRWC